MSEDIADRLDAVERALTDDGTDPTAVRERATLSAELDRLETRVEDIETQVEDLDAALEAVRGYAGNVRAVNREVERRASAALAKAEALETAVDAPDAGPSGEEAGATFDWGPADPERSERPAEHASVRREGTVDGRRTGTDTAGDGSGGTATGPAPDGPGRRPPEGAAGRGSRGGDAGAESRASAAGREDRPSAADSVAGGGRDEGEGERGTERFIERVRDAL